MKKYTYLIAGLKDRRGATAIVVALVLAVLVGITALAVDIGYVAATKNELQNVADAAALAGARQLGAIYEGMSYKDQQTYVCEGVDCENIVSAAQVVAQKNQAALKNITINVPDTFTNDPGGDLVIGQWHADTKSLTATLSRPDAVRVIARRDASINGPIATFFARIFEINTVPVFADATAALTSQSTAPEGGLPLPVGISEARFKNTGCDEEGYLIPPNIRLYPTNDDDSCGGWHTYTTDDPYNTNTDDFKKLLKDLKDGTFKSPVAIAGETKFQFWGATSVAIFDDLIALFNAMKNLNPPNVILDADTDPETWTTTVAVYGSPDCKNPNQSMTIVGFAVVTITNVTKGPPAIVDAKIRCDIITPDSRGSGGSFGAIRGSIPGLVE